MDNPPDFSAQLDPKAFQIQGADDFRKRLQDGSAAIGKINNDWSATNALLDQERQGLGKADKLASGEGLTAADEVRFGQQDLGANNGSPQSLGHALMRLGSRAPAQQNLQAGEAQSAQQMEALRQATNMRLQMAAQQREIFKANLQLSNQKFAMQRGAKQAQDGLDLAQVHLANMFNQAVAGARNAQELAQIQTNQINFDQTMQYLRMGIGATSAAAAGAASIVAKNARLDDSYDGNIDLQQVGPNTWAGLTRSENRGLSPSAQLPDTVPALDPNPVGDFSNAPRPGTGPNSFSALQSLFSGGPKP